MNDGTIIEAREGDRVVFPLTLELDTGRVNIGGMTIGVKDGKTVILDLVIIDPTFTDMFPDHWMGISIPRVEDEKEEVVDSGTDTEAEG